MDGLGNLYTLTSHDEVTLVRKFNSAGKVVLYERSVPGMDRGTSLIQVDQLGVATVLGSARNVNFATYRSAQSCSLTAFPPGLSDGALVRIGPDGALLESTFLGLEEPVSKSLIPWAFSVQTSMAYAVVWTEANLFLPNLNSTTGPHHLALLQLVPDTNGGDGVKLACVGNAATFTGAPLVRGEIVSIFGNGLGSKTPEVGQPGSNNLFPIVLGGSQVTFDGVTAPLLYVSDTQINAIVPWELGIFAGTKVCLSVLAAKTNCILAGTTLSAPGIFKLASGYAAVVNQDGTINSADNPAHSGSTVYIYGTGIGPVQPFPADGSIVQLPVPTLSFPVEALFTRGLVGISGQVLHAGMAPLEVAGLFQIDVKLPPVPNRVPPDSGPWSLTIVVHGLGDEAVAAPSLPISLAP